MKCGVGVEQAQRKFHTGKRSPIDNRTLRTQNNEDGYDGEIEKYKVEKQKNMAL